jgi:hypothetical protein
VIEACASTGLPVWMGLRCRVDAEGGAPLVGYLSDEPVGDRLSEIAALNGEVMTVFHSTIEATDAVLPLIKEAWQGPVAVYPEADRPDYVQRIKDHNIETPVTPDEFVAWGQGCVPRGCEGESVLLHELVREGADALDGDLDAVVGLLHRADADRGAAGDEVTGHQRHVV